jgi:hypothetical protein
MRHILGCLIVVALAASNEAQEKKKAGAILVKADAVEIAAEFEKDAKAARKKYDPRPPKGGAGGTIVEITGVVASVNERKKTVTLETGTKVSVVLQAKKFIGPDQKSKRLLAQATGRFDRFERNTVVIECDEANLLRIVEEKK